MGTDGNPTQEWLKYVILETVKDELKNMYQTLPKQDIDPRKQWICKLDDEEEEEEKHKGRRRRNKKIPKFPNPNIGVRNLLLHIHDAAPSICCIRADHGVGRSTLAHHLAYTWGSGDDDISKLEDFETVFVVSASCIEDELKCLSVTSNKHEDLVQCDTTALASPDDKHSPEIKDAAEKGKTYINTFIEQQENECASGCDFEKIHCKTEDKVMPPDPPTSHMEKPMQGLISSLLPMSTAIHGLEAVSECVLGMKVLLIIDDAEDLQLCGLEFLQQVLTSMHGLDATIILMTDHNGYRRIAQAWLSMDFIKLDLFGLAREDIITEAKVYVEANKTKTTSKLHDLSTVINILPETDLLNVQENEIEIKTEMDKPDSVSRSEILSEACEKNEHSDSKKMERCNSKKTYARELSLECSKDACTNSGQCVHKIHNEIEDKRNHKKSTIQGQSAVMNSKSFVDSLIRIDSAQNTNLEKFEETSYKSKGIDEFLSRNICRLEKILRFPDTLLRTCDMYMDSPDLFDGISTATDLLWTLIHWEGVNALYISRFIEGSQNISYCGNGPSNAPEELTKQTEEVDSNENSESISERLLSDQKYSGCTNTSSRLSGNFSGFAQKYSVCCSGDQDKKFHEKMYNWLLFLGEKSLASFVDDDPTLNSKDFKALKNHTVEVFGLDMATSLLDRIFKTRKILAHTSIPENVQTFVVEHLPTNNLGNPISNPAIFDCETVMLESISLKDIINTENSVMDCVSLSSNSLENTLTFPEVLSTETAYDNSKNSECLCKTMNNEPEFLAELKSPKLEESEHYEMPNFQHSDEKSICSHDSSTASLVQNTDEINIRNHPNHSDCQDMNDAQDDSSNFWNNILECDNSRDLDHVDLRYNPEPLESKPLQINVERDSAHNNNQIADNLVRANLSERAALQNGCNNPTVTKCEFQNPTEMQEIYGASAIEEKGQNLGYEDSEEFCNETQGTYDILIDENRMANGTFDIERNKTAPVVKNIDSPSETVNEIEENDQGMRPFNYSDEDVCGNFLGSDNTQFERNRQNYFHENSIEKDELNSKDNNFVEHEIKIDESRDKEHTFSEFVENLDCHREDVDEPVLMMDNLQFPVIEKVRSENMPERPLEEKVSNSHLECRNISNLGSNNFADDSNHQLNTNDCFAITDNLTADNIIPNSQNRSVVFKETQIPQKHSNCHEVLQKRSEAIVNTNEEFHCQSENLNEKLSPILNSQENVDGDTDFVEGVERQTIMNGRKDDTVLEKYICKETDVHCVNVNDDAIPFVNQHMCHQDGSLNSGEETYCNNEITDKETEDVILTETQTQLQQQQQQQQQNQLQLHNQQQQQQQQQQHLNVNGFEDVTKEEYHRLINNTHETVDETPSMISSGIRNSKTEQEDEKQLHKKRLANILQNLKNRTAPPPPAITTCNPLMIKFLASWFLVHEIQSGRSLVSLTCDSRCCLRQLCIFAAGLINRIRKIVGYNTELNRMRLVSGLLHYSSDSSDDLLFNMELVTEFKAYPDLLSFAVEASEYPDEWHLCLYHVELVPLQALLLNISPSRVFLHVEEPRPFSEECHVLEFLPRVEILVWLDSGCQFAYGNKNRMDKIVASFTVRVVLAKVELVSGCLTHRTLVDLASHATLNNLVYLKLRVLDIESLSSLLSIDRQLKFLLWLEIKLDFDWLSEDEGHISSLPRSSVPLFDVYLRGCADEHVVNMSTLLSQMHQRYSGIHLESTSLTPEGVYVLLKQLKQKEIKLYSHPSARQRFRKWYYPQLTNEPAPSDALARERLGYDDRIFYSNHLVDSSMYATALDAWNLTSFLEEEEGIVRFVYITNNLKFVKRLTGCVEVEKIC